MARMLNIPKDLKKSFSNLIDLIPVHIDMTRKFKETSSYS
jgi:hypothetical protein